MTIDWANFTPWASLSGGILLGLASAIFILVNGRILGISGILGGLLGPKPGDTAWRLAFLLGLLAAPVTFLWIAPAGFLPALAKIRHAGITGPIAFDGKGDLRDAALTLYTYRQGRKTKLQVLRAQ